MAQYIVYSLQNNKFFFSMNTLQWVKKNQCLLKIVEFVFFFRFNFKYYTYMLPLLWLYEVHIPSRFCVHSFPVFVPYLSIRYQMQHSWTEHSKCKWRETTAVLQIERAYKNIKLMLLLNLKCITYNCHIVRNRGIK